MIHPVDVLLSLSSTVAVTMKGLSLLFVILVVSIYHLDAFLPSSLPRHTSSTNHPKDRVEINALYNSIEKEDNYGNSNDKYDVNNNSNNLTHADIEWKLRPPPETPWKTRIWLRFASNFVRLEHKLRGEDPPLVLCPKGGQAVLEAYIRPDDSSSSRKLEKIARFGFSTERGPPAPPIQETVADLYGLTPNMRPGIAAIIYMFVEPKYRKRNVGTLALQVISLIQSIQYCDFTVLVVDDDGSGKLIDWYLKNGYSKAPKLQAILGSPDAVNGITMIAPTQEVLPKDCRIQWW